MPICDAQDEWADALAKKDVDGLAGGAHRRDLQLLLPKIVDLLSDSYVHVIESRYDDLAAVVRELLGTDAEPGPYHKQMAKSVEVVNVLSALRIPDIPATLKDSWESRGNVHFVLKTLWSTPFFARYPHVMWVFRDLINDTIGEVIDEFMPFGGGRTLRQHSGTHGTADSGSSSGRLARSSGYVHSLPIRCTHGLWFWFWCGNGSA